MDDHRFDRLVRALQPASRRSLLGSAIAGVLGMTALALEHDKSSAARRHNQNNNNNRRRRRRRNRRRTWTFKASLSHTNETPPSSGDRFSSGSTAQIKIVQRRRRFQICGNFNYFTTAVANRNINVKDVILQFGNTRNNTPAEFSFPGWVGATGFDAGCFRIGQGQANDIRRNASSYYVNIRTNTPNHPNGAVAGTLVRQ